MSCALCPNCGYDFTLVGELVEIGPLTIEHGKIIRWKGEHIGLGVNERLMLVALARLNGAIIKRPALAELVGYEGEGSRSNYVAVYMNRLNKRFRAVDPSFDQIQNVRGEGVRWRIDA
jgi:DNA-binding response OmpR family regulator